jgi:hypothetical protein
MRVILALAVFAICLSLGGCSYPYETAHAILSPRPLPRVASVDRPPLPARRFPKRRSPMPNQAAYAKLQPSRLLPHPIKASLEETPRLSDRKSSDSRSPSPGAPVLPPAGTMHYVVLNTSGDCAVIDSGPSAGSGKIIGNSGGYASLESANKALKDIKICKDVIAAGAPPTTIDTVGGIANALTLGKTDQAVGIAKAYIDDLRVNVGKYYRGLATDRLASEQAEAAVNLVPGISLFEKPQQGIANLKVLRQGIEKELAIDERGAQNNKFAEEKANQTVLNARRLIRTIGTDEDLDNSLAYMDTLRAEREWPDVVKMLTRAVEEEAEVKFKAAQAKAKRVGGPQKLTREDIDGLSNEQIKQLRGY